MARVDVVTDGVTAALNDAAFATFVAAQKTSELPDGLPEFTATKTYAPAYEDLGQLAALLVITMPANASNEFATREKRKHEITVDVGVIRKLATPAPSTAEIVALNNLVEAIDDYLWNLGALPTAAPWQRLNSANDPIFSPQHLHDMRVYFSVLSVTYTAAV